MSEFRKNTEIFQPPEKKSAVFLVGKTTEASSRHPDRNEDASREFSKDGLIGLSDGAGGHAVGDKMSQEVMRLLAEHHQDIFGKTVDEVDERMGEAVRDIISKSQRFSQANTPEGKSPAMATFLAAKVLETPDGFRAVVKSIGDSMAFVWRADGRVRYLGAADGLPEDSRLQQMVFEKVLSQTEADLISEAASTVDFVVDLEKLGVGTETQIREVFNLPLHKLSNERNFLRLKNNLNQKEAAKLHLMDVCWIFRKYPEGLKAQVTQSVGLPDRILPKDRLDVHTAVVNLSPGDRLILASDGLENLNKKEIDEILSQADSLQVGLEKLRVAASARAQETSNWRAKPDDITLNGILVVPGVRRVRENRLSREQAERLLSRRQSLETARIQKISEVLGTALELAEKDPEITALEEKIKEEVHLRQISKDAEDFVSNIKNTFDRKAVILRVGEMARAGSRVVGNAWVGSGDAYINWDNYILKLNRDLRLLKLRKKYQEKIA